MEPLSLGHYDQHGHACLNVHLCGVKHEPPGIEYEVMIDTGFSGFIQIPIIHAIALQLPLQGTQTLVLANGTKASAFTALVSTTLAGKETVGVAVLSPSETFLVGLDFLRQFDRLLVVSKKWVGLIDESALPPAPSAPSATP